MFKIVALFAFLILAISQVSHSQPVARRHLLNITLSSRTNTLYQRCPVLRIPFYDSQKNQSQSSARMQTASSIGLNGDQLIHSLLINNQTSVSNQISKSLKGVIIYFIFMVIGLAFMIIGGPILICCLCSPYSCPPCRSWRKPQNEGYQTREMKWPAILTIVLSLIVMGTGCAILITNNSLQKGYSETRCSVAMLFDDLLNGNATRDGKDYWLGLKPLQANLSTMVSSAQKLLSNVQSFEDSGKLVNFMIDQIKNIKHDVSDIPRGDGSMQKLQLSYMSPINSINNNKTIFSTFEQTLGSKEQNSSLIGSSYAKLSEAEHSLQLNDLLGEGLPKLGQSLITLFTKYVELINVVENLDTKTDNQLTTVQNSGITPITLVIYILAALSLVFSILLIVAALCICQCNKFSMRKLVYPSCFIISIIGILFFLISLIMSAATMGTHYACHYIDIGLQTKAQFNYRFGPIFNNTLLTQMMAQCATQQGTGILINTNLLNNALASTNHQSNSFNPNDLIQILRESKSNLTEIIRSYHFSENADINSNEDLQILQKLSNPTYYQCTSPGFAADSWVPSVNQQNMYVPCKVQTLIEVTPQTCRSKQQFQSRIGIGCTGCIDTFSIFSQYSSKQQVLSSLNRRYSAPDCQTFNQQLANVWGNFYKKKQQVLSPVEQRANIATQKIDNLTNIIAARYPPLLGQHQHLGNLTPVQPVQQTPLQATVTQLDCKVLGEDAQLITNTFCTQVFNYSFAMRIMTIIISFALLLLMVFSTILAIRAFRSSMLRDNSETPLSVGESGNQKYPMYIPNSEIIQQGSQNINQNQSKRFEY